MSRCDNLEEAREGGGREEAEKEGKEEEEEEEELCLQSEPMRQFPWLVPGETAQGDRNLRNQFSEFCSVDRGLLSSPGQHMK